MLMIRPIFFHYMTKIPNFNPELYTLSQLNCLY